MKSSWTAAAILVFGTALVPAFAEERSNLKGPPQTMGEEGKLPATGTVSGAVPDMRGPGATSPTGSGSGPGSPKGPPKTMGDEGKLPATGTVSGAVPDMRGQDAAK